jgi:hypothetical protein
MSDKGRTRPRAGRRAAKRNAGVFLAPGTRFAVPLRTLSDDYRDEPAASAEESEREPEPERVLPGLVARVVDQLMRRARHVD